MRTLCAVVLVVSSILLGAQEKPQGIVEWPAWGGDNAHTRYSTLSDITPANAGRLEQAWVWAPGEVPQQEHGSRPGSFQPTPLMIDNVLYVSTPYHRAVALDAETGKELWAFDPEAWKGTEDAIGLKHRGVAFWRDRGELRIVLNTDTRLFLLDAKTGKPVESFWREGGRESHRGAAAPREEAALQSNIAAGRLQRPRSSSAAAFPIGFNTSSSRRARFRPSSAKTGKRAWIFNTIPQSARLRAPRRGQNESWNYYRPRERVGSDGASTRPRAALCADQHAERRLLGRPASRREPVRRIAPVPRRQTGKRKWHFQAVHHGLWDYDFASPPNLVTITVDGKRIDAVAAVSNRGSPTSSIASPGEPVWPIEERPSTRRPMSRARGRTRRSPSHEAAGRFGPQGISLDDANDSDARDQGAGAGGDEAVPARPAVHAAEFAGHDSAAVGRRGGTGAGAGFDPETGMLYICTSEGTTISQVCKNDGTAVTWTSTTGNYCEFGALLVSRSTGGGALADEDALAQ